MAPPGACENQTSVLDLNRAKTNPRSTNGKCGDDVRWTVNYLTSSGLSFPICYTITLAVSQSMICDFKKNSCQQMLRIVLANHAGGGGKSLGRVGLPYLSCNLISRIVFPKREGRRKDRMAERDGRREGEGKVERIYSGKNNCTKGTPQQDCSLLFVEVTGIILSA